MRLWGKPRAPMLTTREGVALLRAVLDDRGGAAILGGSVGLMLNEQQSAELAVVSNEYWVAVRRSDEAEAKAKAGQSTWKEAYEAYLPVSDASGAVARTIRRWVKLPR